MAKCPYCENGNKPNEKGEHWIVKSIVPAKIDIRKCRLSTETDKDHVRS